MSWFTPFAGLNKKICRYLLQRYLGQFLEEKLNLEQLNVDLYNGRGTVNNVALNCEALNELCENQGWNVEVIGGHIGSVTITVPWNAPMKDDSCIEVSNLHIALRPLARQNERTSMLESMWSSVSSSLQLAQECIEKDEDVNISSSNATIEGLEKFAQTIDNVLNRIKAKFLNTEIRLEYLPPNSDRGIAVIIKIDCLEYQNEAGSDPVNERSADLDNQCPQGQKTHLISSFASHHITIGGITFYTEEFRIVDGKQTNLQSDSIISSQNFYSTISHLPETEQPYLKQRTEWDSSNMNRIPKNPIEKAEDNDDSLETDELDMEIFSSKIVKIVKIDGKQDLRIKMKQSENLNGPKVDIDFQFGALYIFLTPRQLHLIKKFCDVFLKEQPVVSSDNKTETVESKRARSQKEQQQQQKQRYNPMSGGLGGNEGCWSDPLGTGDSKHYNVAKDTFMGSAVGGDNNSSNIGLTPAAKIAAAFREKNAKKFEYCESLYSSMSTSSTTTCSSKFKQKPNTETTGDISRFNIRLASILAIFLHEDILLESSLSVMEPLSEESVSKLLTLSENFFSHTYKGIDMRDCCEKNHLKLILSPLIVEGEEHRGSSLISSKYSVSASRADFEEILQNVPTPLINFHRIYNTGVHKRPEVLLTFKSSTPIRKGSRSKRNPPRTEINFVLESSTVELDISLYDRLSAILGSSPFATNKEMGEPKKSESLHSLRNVDPIMEIKLESVLLDIRLRFPIADSRPLHDPNRIPWWKQNIRADFVLFTLSQFRLKYALNSVEITANEIDLYYCENLNSEKVHIGKSTLIDKSDIFSREPCIEYPRFVIGFPSDKSLKATIRSSLEDSDSGETSGESCALFSRRDKDVSPFCAKKVCRQSDTPHSKDDISESILLPAETVEMRKFCEKALKTSKLQFQVFLPIASVQINSKQLYEVLYNRINTDLLMWEPSAPNMKSTKRTADSPVMTQSLLNVGMMESLYIPPTSTLDNENDSLLMGDEEGARGGEENHKNHCPFGSSSQHSSSSKNNDSDPDSDNIYYSVYEKKRNKRSQSSANTNTASSVCSFELKVEKGILTLFAPVRDSENRVIPGQFGEFTFKANGFNLFSVSGYRGDRNTSYLCIESEEAEVYHCGLIPRPLRDFPLRLIESILPNYTELTLYPTPNDLTLSGHRSGTKRQQLGFVVEIKRIPEQRVKRIRITTAIQNTTLKYNPALSQHIWLNQMIDMFDVIDYPIEGYKPYSIVTEMQLHLSDCAIDYRPLYFPYRAVAELGSFTISSNLTTSVQGCTLRFIAEECVLALAPYQNSSCPQSKITHKITVLPSSNLVAVLDLGLLDISLRLNDKPTEFFPKFDMRVSIQDIHIRTCSDSGKALAQLITYIAEDGDLKNPNDEEVHTSSDEDNELLPVKDPKQKFPEITEKQQERVNTLMAEALRETVSAPLKESEEDDTESDLGVEVFFFPDENKQVKKLKEEKSLNQDDSSDSDNQSCFTEKARGNSLESLDTQSTLTGKPKRSSSEEWEFKARRESESSNELRDIINFETSIMAGSYNENESQAVEALPQIKKDLGDVQTPSRQKQSKQSRPRKDSTTDDDFYLIAEEEHAYMSKCGIKDIKVSEDPLRIVDNHFSLPHGKPDLLKAPEGFPMAVTRYTLCEMTLTWHLYAGHDFPKEGENKSAENSEKKESEEHSTQKPMSEAYMSGVSFSKDQQNVQFVKKPISKLSWKTRGGDTRKHDTLIEIQLTKVRLSHEVYPTHTTQASRQVLIISELEIRDRLQSSEINKFLYHPSAKHLPNRSSQHMVVIKALHVRPNPILAESECCLRISLLPLRLNIDQDTLLFFVEFFIELSSNDEESAGAKGKRIPKPQPPVMMVDDIPEAVQDLQARHMVSTNLDLLMEDEKAKEKCEKQRFIPDEGNNQPIFFREVIFSPRVEIRLDYHGKRRMVASKGAIASLLMGLGHLHCSKLELKPIHHKFGLLGVEKLLDFFVKEWLQDIKRNQLPAILSGVGPLYGVVQLIQGICDLFWLPYEQYQKDGRIVRGLQLGAQSFTARTALAALELTSRIIQLLQITAETAFDMVSPGPSVRTGRLNRKGKRKRQHRPQDIREGIVNAYQIVREGINETANTLIETTAAEHDQKGYTGAVGAVFRQIPPIVVCPVVLATQATTNVLGGVKNQLVPDAKLEAREKWKEDTD